jgi:23S rRNA pseudouridine2604 synthase
MRVNKYISICTTNSLRDALRLIDQRRVKINGRILNTNKIVKRKDVVAIDEKLLVFEEPTAIYLAFNKPRGIECTADRNNPNNILDALNYSKAKLVTIGRLDKDSEGLILLTNNGDIVNRIIHSDFQHEKEYEVYIDRPIENLKILDHMRGGLDLWDYITQPCKIEKLDESNRYFKFILQEGKNRQIRRMFEKFGFNVVELKRVRVINIELKSLAIGEYRALTQQELKTLSKEIDYNIPEKLEMKF